MSNIATFKRVCYNIPGLRAIVRKLRGKFQSSEIKAKPKKNHRLFLLKFLPKSSVGAEIGVLKGDFSQQILETTRPTKLHLIDPWEHQTSETYKDALYGGRAKGGQQEVDSFHDSVIFRFKSQISADQVEIHRGYSTTILKQFPDGYLDWIYIDGNHLYDYVKEDLELAYQKVKQGGYITGDDYDFSPSEWWQGGVKRAVDEFLESRRVRLVEIKNHQFILQKT